MKLTVEIDTSRIEAKFAKMIADISEFGKTAMPDELMQWQLDDLHRTYPKVDVPDEHTAAMSIETHVQKAELRSSSPPRVRRVLAVHRPVVRPEMITRLCERMAALMQEKLSWR